MSSSCRLQGVLLWLGNLPDDLHWCLCSVASTFCSLQSYL